MAVYAGDRGAIRVSGLDALRATLRVMSRDSGKATRAVLAEAAGIVADEARARAARQGYKTPAARRTGAYAKGFKPSVSGSRIAVVNRWPGANVNHWGGTIRPRGVPITFPRRPVIAEAAAAKEVQFEAALTRAVNALADRIR